MQTEEQIIKGCQKYHKPSQFELVKRYSGMLMTVSRRYIPDHSSAKDVVQESFILIFKNIHNYKPTGSFEAWMRKITMRSALLWIKKRNRHKEDTIDGILEIKTVEPKILSQLKEEDLIKLIQDIPLGFRTIFNLSIIEGYSHREIAKELNITESTSRSQLVRARRFIQKKLVEHQNQ